MAEYGIFWDGYILFNAVDLSDFVTSMTLTTAKEVIDLSAMGDAGKVRSYGLEDHRLDIVFNEDITAAKVLQTCIDAWQTNAAFPVNFRLASGAIAVTNPEFQCSYVFSSYPLGGQHGQLLRTSISLLSSGVMVIDETA